jgi:hypothetical protein
LTFAVKYAKMVATGHNQALNDVTVATGRKGMRTANHLFSFVPRASAVEVHALNAFPCTPLGTYFHPEQFFCSPEQEGQ